jgi:hypothetical protein
VERERGGIALWLGSATASGHRLCDSFIGGVVFLDSMHRAACAASPKGALRGLLSSAVMSAAVATRSEG